MANYRLYVELRVKIFEESQEKPPGSVPEFCLAVKAVPIGTGK